MGRIQLVQKQKGRLQLAQSWAKVGGGIAACAYCAMMMVGNIGQSTDSHANNLERVQEVVYQETFEDYMNGDTESSLWSIGDDKRKNASEDYYFEVRKGQYLARAVGKEKVWTSSDIDISNLEEVSVSVQVSQKGKMEGSDYISTFYQVDDQEETPFTLNGKMEGAFGEAMAQQDNIAGNTVRVIVKVKNNEFNESHMFDNVMVGGYEKSQIEDMEANIGTLQ